MKFGVLVGSALLVSGCTMYDSSLLDEAQGQPMGPNGAQPGLQDGAGGTFGLDEPPLGAGGSFLQASGGGLNGASGGVGSGGGAPVGTGGANLEQDCMTSAGEVALSDFETGLGIVVPTDGRSGSWFVFNDGSGTQLPVKPSSGSMPAEPAGACGSAYGLRTWGNSFTGWGAGIGTDIVPKVGSDKGFHDLSAYRALRFFAKAAAPTVLRVSLEDRNTSASGGVCDASAGSGEANRCGDYFGVEVILGTGWQAYEVTFDELRQRGFGQAIAEGFLPSAVAAFRAQVSEGLEFDYTLDELTFVPAP